MIKTFRLTMALVLVIQLGLFANADERLKGVACRSVHLWYPAEKGTAFYNEITVKQSAEGTYFMVCGWNKGYFGIQELSQGKKVVLFSVWDSNQNNPNAVAKEKRTLMLHKDDAVRVKRFGGEGSGGQSFFDYDWKVGETYRLMVTAKPNKDRTEYAGYFFVPETKTWKHLVTFSTITGGKPLSGYYSFVEDFKRNRVSATITRKAEFGNGWVRTEKGEWTPLDKSKFTADRNPVLNINAGLAEDRFFLATGGKIENSDTKLGQALPALEKKERTRPTDLPVEK